VSTVAESPERVEHLIEVVQAITGAKGSNFFLFAKKLRFFGRMLTGVW